MNIKTDDIIRSIGLYLLAAGYYEANTEAKAMLVNKELKDYLVRKNIQAGYFLSDKEIEKMSSRDLLSLLYEFSGRDRNVVDQVTHYIIGLLSEMQGYGILWYIEEDEKYIKKPTIQISENKINKLITHMDTDPLLTFNFVLEYYNNKYLNQGITRKRENIQLPKNGEE